jgi:phosphatidylglycerol:prolipoprotein diacylglycerol transferase
MFIHNINPTLLTLGPLEIRYYGLVYVITIIICYLFLKKKTKKTGIKNVDDFLLYLIVGLLIGARLFEFIFTNPSIIIKQPLEIFKVWHGGMSFFGGLAGAITATIIYCKKNNKNYWKITDLIIFPVIIGLILGRIANFINAELVGTITNLPWCVMFPGYTGCRHPYQIYAAISHLVLFGIIYLIYRIKNSRKIKSGIVFLSFTFFYSLLRLITDFVREEPRFLGLTVWQYISIATMIISLIIFIKKYKKLINRY